MGLLSELLVFSLFLCCGESFMFFLWEKAKEPLEKAPCGVPRGKHTRVRLNCPAHAQGWLGYKCLWLLFVFVLYVTLKFWVHSKNKTKEQNPLGLQGYPFRSLCKKNQHASPSQDCAFTTSTHPEMDLMKLVAKVRNLKAAMTPRSNLRLNNPDFPMDPQNCVVLYDVWGENAE
ncbi:protein FAM209B [Heterocephalus glaber]|uniref:Protein FAM209B n=1 Tax=Heterocephalus glaber TaxID=10181 RepID=A0AAX6PS44_HETGA|nr:protein FAM209B [Heterocephalus glaber]